MANSGARSFVISWEDPNDKGDGVPALHLGEPMVPLNELQGNRSYPPLEDTAGLGRLAGVWIKDREASDLESYSRTLDLMRLGALQKVRQLGLTVDFPYFPVF